MTLVFPGHWAEVIWVKKSQLGEIFLWQLDFRKTYEFNQQSGSAWTCPLVWEEQERRESTTVQESRPSVQRFTLNSFILWLCSLSVVTDLSYVMYGCLFIYGVCIYVYIHVHNFKVAIYFLDGQTKLLHIKEMSLKVASSQSWWWSQSSY